MPPDRPRSFWDRITFKGDKKEKSRVLDQDDQDQGQQTPRRDVPREASRAKHPETARMSESINFTSSNTAQSHISKSAVPTTSAPLETPLSPFSSWWRDYWPTWKKVQNLTPEQLATSAEEADHQRVQRRRKRWEREHGRKWPGNVEGTGSWPGVVDGKVGQVIPARPRLQDRGRELAPGLSRINDGDIVLPDTLSVNQSPGYPDPYRAPVPSPAFPAPEIPRNTSITLPDASPIARLLSPKRLWPLSTFFNRQQSIRSPEEVVRSHSFPRTEQPRDQSIVIPDASPVRPPELPSACHFPLGAATFESLRPTREPGSSLDYHPPLGSAPFGSRRHTQESDSSPNYHPPFGSASFRSLRHSQEPDLPAASHPEHFRVVDLDFVHEFLAGINPFCEPVLPEQDLVSLVEARSVRQKLQHFIGLRAFDVQCQLRDTLVRALLEQKERVRIRGEQDAKLHVNNTISPLTSTSSTSTTSNTLPSTTALTTNTLPSTFSKHAATMNGTNFNTTAGAALPPMPTVEQFASEINNIIKARDGTKLADFMTLYPQNMSGPYLQMRQQLQQVYDANLAGELEAKIQSLLPATEETSDHGAFRQFTRFLVQYFEYLKDVTLDESKYIAAYELMTQLQQKANTALGHPTLGHLMLDLTVTCAQLLAWLAIRLDKRPDLTQHLKLGGGGEDDPERVSLPEQCVNTIRTALTACCQDRLGGLDENNVPTGKKAGIYKFANVMFKILFQCQNLQSAAFFLENIFQQSPPLGAYSRRDRVTYLYYLGRFHFHYGHFWRAHLALQAAYDESPAIDACIKQRRLILIFLIASNILNGRFPSAALFQRPEAVDLPPRFLPLCNALRTGDVRAYRQALSNNSPNYPFFAHYRIYMQLLNVCEILLRRTLVRNAFKTHGVLPSLTPGATPNAAPTLHFRHLTPILGPNSAVHLSDDGKGNPRPVAPDYEGLSAEQMHAIFKNFNNDVAFVVSGLTSLVGQSLIHGFVSEKHHKLAIRGASKGLPAGVKVVQVGFPPIYQVAGELVNHTDFVPGWKKVAGAGGGMVISLSGAGAVGS